MTLKNERMPIGNHLRGNGSFRTLGVVLPFGWASRHSKKAMPDLWRRAIKGLNALGAVPSAVVFTSPHYSILAEALAGDLPTYYYCSDDYLSYEGWDSSWIHAHEAKMISVVRKSFFVSRALRDRALTEYGIECDRTAVVPNATAPEYLERVELSTLNRLFDRYPTLQRPVAGVVGSISSRLDLELLLQIAAIPSLGSLALVGKMDGTRGNQTLRLLSKHLKVVCVGEQPQGMVPAWEQLFDIALIPYRASQFNYNCSPLRLFDHLAAGRPIISTAACAQVMEFADYVHIADTNNAFLEALRGVLAQPVDTLSTAAQIERARGETWPARARILNEGIETKC